MQDEKPTFIANGLISHISTAHGVGQKRSMTDADIAIAPAGGGISPVKRDLEWRWHYNAARDGKV